MHRYQVVKIEKFEDLVPYSAYTDWCIIFTEMVHEYYLDGGRNRLFVLIREDMPFVSKQEGAGYPCDEYGLSLIDVIVSPDGDLESVTSRWNSLDEEDHLLSSSELKSLLGNQYEMFFK